MYAHTYHIPYVHRHKSNSTSPIHPRDGTRAGKIPQYWKFFPVPLLYIHTPSLTTYPAVPKKDKSIISDATASHCRYFGVPASAGEGVLKQTNRIKHTGGHFFLFFPPFLLLRIFLICEKQGTSHTEDISKTSRKRTLVEHVRDRYDAFPEPWPP